MRKKRFINTTGYTKGESTANNPYNIIPSQDITMQNVDYPLQATPLDQYGNPIGSPTLMMPNEDYFFEGADFVEERPLPEMQMGGWQNPFGQGYSTQENPQLYQEPQSNFNMLPQIKSPQIFGQPQFDTNFYQIRKKSEANMEQNMNEMSTGQLQQNNGKPLYQFANPYGSQNFETSLFNLGESIGNKNGAGIATFGGLSLLKGASTVLQGLGAGKTQNRNMKNFYQNFRDNMTGNSNYLQNGGIVNDTNSFKQLLNTNKIKSYSFNKETNNYEVEFE